MSIELVKRARPRFLWPLGLVLIASLLVVPLIGFPRPASAAVIASDDFNRANGGLGANWTAVSDGSMTISSQAVIGAVGATTGDIRTAEAYPSDQYSAVTVTSTQLTGGQWVGAGVRLQSSGRSGYAGIYYWNFGSPQLLLYKRSGGSWTQLGGAYSPGPLAAGTQLQVSAVGNAISFLVNGVQRLTVTDGTFTGGAPGIMAYGNGKADSWSGGSAGSGSGGSFTVGGSVSGLSGTVVLQDNGGDDLSVTASGPFTFATKVASGAAYAVTVKTNPSGQTCTVASGSGTMGSANVTSVAVSCTSNPSSFTVGGSVSGLSGTVVLQDNGGDDLSVAASGPFTFATKVASGAAYAVTVKTNPSGQTCTVASGTGTMGSANVTSVAVSCTSNPSSFTVGGSVSGLSGTVVLQDNGGDDLSVAASGPFTFATKVATGAGYAVTVKTNPSGQTCTVASGTGTMGSANVTSVAVSCTSNPSSFTVGGSVSGLSGTVVLQDNGGDDLSVTASGPFTFATKVTTGAAYAVTVKTNPSGQTCTVASGTGTMGSANVTSVAVSCTSNPSSFTVGGSVSGLSGTVVLQDNGGDDLSVTASGPFTFATKVTTGAAYAVTVKTNPSGQTCTVASGTGTMGSANVTSVAVSCTSNPSSFTVGGSVSGLSGTVVLQDNGGDDLSVTASGPFTFATKVTTGAGYAVTVKTNPSGQTCTVASGTGTMGSANVTSVAVSCTSNPSSFTVGGSVSGLSGTVVLQDNGGDDLSVTASGPFTFATKVTTGAGYAVTVKTNPSGQTCTVASGTGTMGSANVTSVAVTCAASTGSSGSDDFNRANGGLGANWTAVSDGSMTISSQAVIGAVGATTGDIRTAEAYPSDQYSAVTVTSTQLTGGQWVGAGVRLQSSGRSGYAGIYYWNFGSPQLLLYKRSGGSWTQLGGAYSPGPLAAGTQLQVSAVGNAISFLVNGVQRLTVTDGTFTGGAPGIMAYGNGKADSWSGGSAGSGSGGSFTVGGSVSGLSGTVVLQDNGGDDLSVTASGPFTFATKVASGAAYAVTVKTNPSGQTCTVASGSGTMGSANVTSVAVSCTTAAASFTVGGSVSGLSGTVVLQDNGGDDLSVTASGPFTFATKVTTGAGYAVTVKTNPSGQSCSVANGTGTMGSANVTSVAVSCATSTGSSGSDDFNRADGGLGAGWTATSDGAMAISSQLVTGTAGQITGEIRTAETYASDQYSTVAVTSTQLTGSQWIGPAVRVQNGGQNAYLGVYYWNSGSPELVLYVRNAGSWTQIGAYDSGPLAAGTQLKLLAVGNTIAFLANGVERIAVMDTTLSGGAPGIMANDSAKADNWTGGAAGFQADLLSTSGDGVKTYDVISANNGYGPQTLRVLAPTNPVAGVAHNFIIALPVQAGTGTTYGDGLATLEALDAQDRYNLTIIAPSFAIDPWFADNPADARLQYETFMTQELEPWIKQNLATTGSEQTWLIGFSKSGIAGQDLILKHPDLFSLAASWDFPADMSSYDQYGAASSYGTDANFQANYRLTPAFMDAHKAPFVSSNRIWIGGYNIFQTDISDYNALLTAEGMAHSTETPQNVAHSWNSGWVPIALTSLYQDSLNLSG